MPAVPPYLVDALWVYLEPALTRRRSRRQVFHPLGCHRQRVADRLVFERLLFVLVTGAAYSLASVPGCSATTLRRRRNEWMAAGLMARLETWIRDQYHCQVGLRLGNIAIDGCIVKAPKGGEVAGKSPVDRAKRGTKRSLAVDARGIPLAVVLASANTHDSPLLGPTLTALERAVELPTRTIIHLDKGYDSIKTRALLKSRGLQGRIAQRGQSALPRDRFRWVVERTNAWHNSFGKLRRMTEVKAATAAFFVALANAIIITRRLLAEGGTV